MLRIAKSQVMIHYFDSHAHLTSSEMMVDIEAVMGRALSSGVTSILNICTTAEELSEGLVLSQSHPAVRLAAATPPHTVSSDGEQDFSVFEEAARKKQLAAIGETGLDYHYLHSPKEIQKNFLKIYLCLAAETTLPVIFHCREAFADLFAIVDAELPKENVAILHCFTGTLREAKQVIERGWYLSLSGIVTFKKSEVLREVAKFVPLNQLLIETDAPYLAPQKRRGKRNEPAFLPETAACIAEAKAITLEEVARVTKQNAEKIFSSH